MSLSSVLQTRRLRCGTRVVQVCCARCGSTRWVSRGEPTSCPCTSSAQPKGDRP